MTEFEFSAAEIEASLPGPAPGELVVEPGTRAHAFRALRSREFRLLFSASALGDVGYWISFIALQAQMADMTDDSTTWLGILFFVNFIPMLLFAPFAGVVADRVERKSLLVAIRGAIAVISAVIGALVLGDLATPGVLAAMAFLIGTAFAFLGPAQSASLANTVPEDDLVSAVSMASVGNNLSRVAGPALAAPILAAWGPGWAFVVYAASSALVALLLVPIHLTSRLDRHGDRSAWQRWKEGLQHARERPPAVAALVTMTVFSVFGAAQIALYPVFASDVFHRPTHDFTFIVVASGVGAVAGAIGNGLRRTVPRLRVSLRFLGGYALASLGFALCGSWTIALVFALLIGFCYFSMTVALNTLLQHLADDEKRGRMMSLFLVTWGGLVPVGALWMGSVAAHTGAPFVVALGAVVCLVFALGSLARILRVDQRSTAPLM